MEAAPEDLTLEQLARRALDGDRTALAGVLRGLEGTVYALALRMLWNREDAEDATQEILVRVMTRLAQFDFQSRLKTWVFRVATNYLIDVKKSCVEQRGLTFTAFADDLADGLSSDGPADSERSLLTEEVKIGCTLGMLQCLDRPHRLAYILGEIFELPAPDAAAALDVTPAAFRKRLQHAREAIEAFTRAHCGLVSDAPPCRCNRRVQAAIRLGRVRPHQPAFAGSPASFEEARAVIRQVEQVHRAAEMQRSAHPRSPAPDIATLILSAFPPLVSQESP